MTPIWKTPRTWRPGDVARNLTAAVLNRELRDLLLYLYDNLGATPTVEAWIAPTLSSPWVEYGSPEAPVGYCKDPFGFVHLRGTVKDGDSGDVVFVLPVGYRPAVRCRVAIATQSAEHGQLRIDTNGNVRGIALGTWVTGDYIALDSSFRID